MSTDRVFVAMRIARDLDACKSLLRGEPVDEARLDPRGLAWAIQMRFVRLDVAGIDSFFQQLHAHDLEEAA